VSSDQKRAAPSASALDDSLTRDELQQALRDESVALIEANWFARIAEIEGQVEAAKAFREIAEQHAINARGTLDLLMRSAELLDGSPAGSTAQNLSALTNFYARDASSQADRANTARREGFSDIGSWFESLGRLRAAHASRLAAIRDGNS
jgi:rubrerythrin